MLTHAKNSHGVGTRSCWDIRTSDHASNGKFGLLAIDGKTKSSSCSEKGVLKKFDVTSVMT